jgi:tetratricopeptide (TPR) repeat protein
MSNLQKFKDDYILLCEAGFIAVSQTDEDAASKLFKAAELLDPDNYLPKVGYGYLHLCKLEIKKASEHFEGVLAKDPNNEVAKAFLGLGLCFTPTEVSKGEKYLEDSAQNAKDPSVKALAVSALEFVEKFVKRTASPMAPPKK